METIKLLLIVYLASYLLCIPGLWKIFTKCGYKGWLSLIPIYNLIIVLRIIDLSGWYLLLYLVPFLAIVVEIIIALKLSKSFSGGIFIAIGLSLWITRPIFCNILGYGKYEFAGSDGLV